MAISGIGTFSVVLRFTRKSRGVGVRLRGPPTRFLSGRSINLQPVANSRDGAITSIGNDTADRQAGVRGPPRVSSRSVWNILTCPQ